MEESKSWLNYTNKNVLTFLYKPFIIYGKQFLKFFIFSVIIEFIFFGIFQLVEFEVALVPFAGGSRVAFDITLDYVAGSSGALFFIMLIFAVSFFIIRSTLISNTSWLTFEKGKANVFQVLDGTFSKIKEILIFTVFFAALMVFPILLTTVALIIMVRDYVLSWFMIGAAVFIPLFLGIKLAIYNAGMTKDNLHVGTALQTSWNLSGRKNWFKTCLIFIIYSLIGIVIPWSLSIYFKLIYSEFIYIGIIMVFVRAVMYPLFDIAMTHLYLNYEAAALDEAVFKEEIIEQKKRSEQLVSNLSRKNHEESV